jgi:hypothetical protein
MGYCFVFSALCFVGGVAFSFPFLNWDWSTVYGVGYDNDGHDMTLAQLKTDGWMYSIWT